MTEPDSTAEIARLLRAVSQAHHDDVGAVDPQWPRWYAEHLVDALNDTLHRAMSVDELSAWIEEADRRYREDSPDVPWPDAYALWLTES